MCLALEGTFILILISCLTAIFHLYHIPQKIDSFVLKISQNINLPISTKDGETFQELTPVPVAAEEYCVAGIDSDRIFVTSLGDYKDDSYMFSRHIPV